MRANRISILASIGLVAVLATTAALTFWSDRVEHENRDDATAAHRMSDVYTKASNQAQRAEQYIGFFTSTGDPQYLAQQRLTQDEFVVSLAAMSDSAILKDRQFGDWARIHFGPMSDIFLRLDEQPPPPYEDLLQEYLVAYQALYASVLAGEIGDPILSRQLEDPRGITDPSQLTSNPVTIIMAVKAAQRENDAKVALAAAVRSESVLGWGRRILYGVATVLVLLLFVVSLRFGKREAKASAENAQLRRLSTTDALTRLGNRRGYEEAVIRLAHAPDGIPASLIMMDLDDFKVVNDTFGHARGDTVLQAFADLISRLAPPGASRFRVGGDEFAMLVQGLDAAASLELAEKLRRSAAEDLESGVTVTAGIAMMNPSNRDVALLQQMADAALYEGKMRGRNACVLYTDDHDASPVFPATKLHAVRLLLEEGRIEPVFQPIWNIHTNTLYGYEGLSRPHPDYGLSGPQEAFDIAEQFGHAADLDRLCRNHLLEAAMDLPTDVRLFVNLSPYSLTQQSFSPAALLEEVEAAGLEPKRIVFEITEKSSIPTATIVEAVEAIRREGFAVALDDVGAGNNGLEMLRKVPVDFIKIDRAVIVSAQGNGMGAAALLAILAFASESGAIVVAEGIEDAAMFSTVRNFASQTSLKGKPGLIHGVQGFMFGMPMPAAEAARALPPQIAA